MKRNTQNKGITLVALVVTIVVLLILAGITLVYVLGDNGIFKKAQEAKIQAEVAQAREKLEVILNSVQLPKQTNPEYNENDFLNKYILGEIGEVEIVEDIVILDEYAFELDRSVPKIGEYVGKKDELIFPKINISEPIISDDFKSASFTITAREENNGISKIQIIQGNDVLQEYTYENRKDEIAIDFIAKQNGKYKVKVYAKLPASKEVIIDGIVMAVEYTPNGSIEYKKEHQVKVSVKETADKVKSLKYQWTNTAIEPQASTFIENCNNEATILGRGFTGTYYLWTLLETESGKTNICRSEGFNFDNEGPNVTVTSTPVSETSFTLTVTASDMHSSLTKCEFYIENELKGSKDISSAIIENNISVDSMNYYDAYVIVTDKAGNAARNDVQARTKLYAWDTFNVIKKRIWIEDEPREAQITWYSDGTFYQLAENVTFTQGRGYIYDGINTYGPSAFYSNRGKVTCDAVNYYYDCISVAKAEPNAKPPRWTYNVIKHSCHSEDQWIKGENKNRIVMGIDENQYPLDGEKNEIWYVKRSELE